MQNLTLKTAFAVCSLLFALSLCAQQEGAGTASQQESVSVSDPLKQVAAHGDASAKAEHGTRAALAAKPRVWSEDAKKHFAAEQQGVATVRGKDEPQKIETAAPYSGPGFVRLLVAFAIMAVLLYGLYYFLKRFGRKMSGQDGSSVKIVSKLSLDSRNSLALIQFHEEELLLSVNSAGGVQLLSKCAQIELAEAEANAGAGAEEVEENDSLPEEATKLFSSFPGFKAASLGTLKAKGGVK